MSQHRGGKRVFIAIKLPDRLKKELGKVQRHLEEQLQLREQPPAKLGGETRSKKQSDLLRFQNPDQLHITLAFLGRISPEREQQVIAVAGDIAQKSLPFSLYATQLGAFPRLRRPSVVWVGLGGDTSVLELLVLRLEQELSRRGILPIRGAGGFVPHIAIARASRKDRRHNLAALGSLLEDTRIELSDLPIHVQEIIVYQSNLGGRGPRYVPIRTIPLGNVKD